jgi:O-antigen biosynthesis protein WbqP
MYKGFIKRFIDIIASFSVILLLSPIYLIIAFIIYIQDKGNPVFKQFRVGKNETEFKVFKFRSMPVNTSNVPSSEVSKITITPFGKFIRRTNLDELPQLFNILKGDMSLIGPRPSLGSQTELIELRRSKNVYKCRPGLTGLAQVNAFDEMPDDTKAMWDGRYVQNITFMNDVRIVLKTLIYLTKKPPTY